MSWTHCIRQILSRPFALPLYISKSMFLRLSLTTTIREAKLSLGLYDPLTQLASKYKSDKGITIFPFHGYTIHYAVLFSRFREQNINLLEIGLARREDRHSLGITCPSLSIWIEYFPKANIYGFDIDDFSSVKLPRAQIFRGDQGNMNDLLKLVSQCSMFDIIIDDGSHASYHQQLTMKTLFPYLASQGLYIIEDLNFQPEEIETALPCDLKTKALLKDRAALNEVLSGVSDVLFFDSPIQGGKEGLGVIVKK